MGGDVGVWLSDLMSSNCQVLPDHVGLTWEQESESDVDVSWLHDGYMASFFFNVGKFQQGLPKKRKGFHCTDDLLLGSRRFDPQRNRSFSLPRTPKVVRGFFRLRIHRCVFFGGFFLGGGVSGDPI